MKPNVEGIRGDFRKFTPEEVGLLIRWHRKERQIKRAALAAAANVSEKTLERAEAGGGVNEESLRRIAEALGVPADAFTTAHYFRSSAEAEALIKQAAAERARDMFPVKIEELRSVKQVLPLFMASSLMAQTEDVQEPHMREVAALQELLVDWGDIVREIPHTAQVDAAQSVLDQVRAVEALGYIVKAGVAESYRLGGDTPFPLGVVVFFAKPKLGKATCPTEVWMPKKFSPQC